MYLTKSLALPSIDYICCMICKVSHVVMVFITGTVEFFDKRGHNYKSGLLWPLGKCVTQI